MNMGVCSAPDLDRPVPLFAINRDPIWPRRASTSDDPIAILRYAKQASDVGFRVALATLTEIRGGAARAKGAQMAIRSDGSFCRYISGGCLESAIAAEAIEAIAADRDRDVRFGEGSRFVDIVLPCGGGVTINIHVMRDTDAVNEVLAILDRRHPIALFYDRIDETLSCRRRAVTPSGFARAFRPRCRLLLQGRGGEVDILASMAEAAGYEVLAGDAIQRDDIDADTAIALLQHDLDRELPNLLTALGGNSFYLGALGSRRTHAQRRQILADLGYPQSAIDRIRAPIGLLPRARDAATLAISIFAEIAEARMKMLADAPHPSSESGDP